MIGVKTRQQETRDAGALFVVTGSPSHVQDLSRPLGLEQLELLEEMQQDVHVKCSILQFASHGIDEVSVDRQVHAAHAQHVVHVRVLCGHRSVGHHTVGVVVEV